MTTFDPSKKAATTSDASVTLSNGNLTAACVGNASVLSTDAVNEAEFVIVAGTEFAVGIHDGSGTFGALPGWDGGASLALYKNGYLYCNSAYVPGLPVVSYDVGDKIRFLVTGNTIGFFKNDSPSPILSYTGANVSGKVYACAGSFSGASCNINATFGAAAPAPSPAPSPSPSPAPSPTPAPGPTPTPPPAVITGWTADALVPYAFVRVPAGAQTIAGTLEILTGQTWFFEGAVITHPGGEPLFRSSASGWSMTGALRAIGTGASTFMRLQDARRFNVEGMDVEGFGGGLKIVDTPGGLPRGNRGKFSKMTFLGGVDAIELNDAAEYYLFSELDVTGNLRGITTAGGNNQFHNGNVVDNGTGVILLPGYNNGHGGFHGMNINHNGVNVEAEGITNGHTFNGCHFYGDSQTLGKIHLVNSKGVSFVGGEMDCAVVGEGMGWNSVMNVTATGDNFSVSGPIVKQGCIKRDGSPA